MKRINFYLTVVILLLSLQSIAQKTESTKSIKVLHVGDTIPDVTLEHMMNYGKNSGKLSEFKGKALIIDFWNKSCLSCIAALPKMERLHDEFKNKFAVLVVAGQKREEFDLLFKNSLIVKSCKLPMVFSNEILYNQMFPHRGDPYQIWIDKQHVVKGIAYEDFAKPENVRDLIEGKTLKIPNMEYLVMNEENTKGLPRLLINDGALAKYVLSFRKIQTNEHKSSDFIDTINTGKSLIDLKAPYYSMVMKSLAHLGVEARGLASGIIINPLTGEKIGVNEAGTLVSFYQAAYGVNNIKVIFEGNDQYYRPSKKASPLEMENYGRNAYIVYELAYPGIKNIRDEICRNILKRDLENAFSLTGTLEQRKLKCLVLYRTTEADKLSTKGGERIKEITKDQGVVIKNHILNAFISAFGFYFLQFEKEGAVFINESGISANRRIDMVLHSKKDDIPGLNKELGKYGLGLKEEFRVLPALVLRKIQ